MSLARQARSGSAQSPATLPCLDVPARPSPMVSAIATPVKRLVRRRQEIIEIQALLQRTDVCLVTLTGPGGIGKTRPGG